MVQFRTDAAAERTSPRYVLLADIGYGGSHWRDRADPRRIVIGTAPIGGALREIWRLPAGPVNIGWAGDIGYVQSGGFLFAHLLVAEPPGVPLTDIVHQAYSRLLAFVHDSGCPELLRMWNYLSRINDDEHGLERYQAFCRGRAQAFDNAGIQSQRFPAATAIGCAAPGLSVHLLAGHRPGTPIENPRQISAYRYPLCYGPRPPSFARAICYTGPEHSRELAISGTASIIGHLTMHARDPLRQVRETLRNMDALVDHASAMLRSPANPPLLLKVYLRDPAHLPEIAPVLRAWAGPRSRILFLHGAICRQALDIEIEAHCATPGRATGWHRERNHADL